MPWSIEQCFRAPLGHQQLQTVSFDRSLILKSWRVTKKCTKSVQKCTKSGVAPQDLRFRLSFMIQSCSPIVGLQVCLRHLSLNLKSQGSALVTKSQKSGLGVVKGQQQTHKTYKNPQQGWPSNQKCSNNIGQILLSATVLQVTPQNPRVVRISGHVFSLQNGAGHTQSYQRPLPTVWGGPHLGHSMLLLHFCNTL